MEWGLTLLTNFIIAAKMASGCRSGNGGSPSGCGEYMFFLRMQMCFTHINMSKNKFAENATRH